MILAICKVLLFPGLLFLGVYSFWLEFVDRKVYAAHGKTAWARPGISRWRTFSSSSASA
jgi:hypothetical protein